MTSLTNTAQICNTSVQHHALHCFFMLFLFETEQVELCEANKPGNKHGSDKNYPLHMDFICKIPDFGTAVGFKKRDTAPIVSVWQVIIKTVEMALPPPWDKVHKKEGRQYFKEKSAKQHFYCQTQITTDILGCIIKLLLLCAKTRQRGNSCIPYILIVIKVKYHTELLIYALTCHLTTLHFNIKWGYFLKGTLSNH